MMNRISAFALIVVFAGALLVAGCGSSSSPAAPTPTPPSAPYSAIDVSPGTGATATLGRTVTVAYILWLYDPTKTDGKGTQVQANSSFAFQLGVGAVIPGWDQGVVGMKVGGLRRLVVPPNLGYGANAQTGIPANSTLVFDISLLAVN